MNDVLAGLREVRMLSKLDDRVTPAGPKPLGHGKRPSRALRLGIIASEFPPGHGGMQEHARGLVESLACDHQICVYVSHGLDCGAAGRNVTINPIMRWKASHDLPLLERASVDAWITLNAGLAPYAKDLCAPLFAYVHGNDFLRPWLPHPDRPVRLARRICGEWIVRDWRTGEIGSGLRAARWIFANSAFSRGLCSRMYGIAEDRFTVVPPGMRHEFFRLGQPATAGRLRLVTVSRLAANASRKNIDGVLHAVARLRGEIDISYTVIGDGDDLPRLRKLAGELGLAPNVRFLGSVDTGHVIEEFSRSDALVMAVKPSETDVEGFGMVYAEAAATGLPSIGTNTGGIPEVIENGVTGLLLDDVSAAGIADGLRQFSRTCGDFDRRLISTRAERFSASHCARMIADRIASMI